MRFQLFDNIQAYEQLLDKENLWIRLLTLKSPVLIEAKRNY